MCLSYSWPIPLSLSRTHIEPHNWDWGILVVKVNDVGVMFATILIMYVILLQLLCYCLHNRFGQNRFFSNPPKVSLRIFLSPILLLFPEISHSLMFKNFGWISTYFIFKYFWLYWYIHKWNCIELATQNQIDNIFTTLKSNESWIFINLISIRIFCNPSESVHKRF